MSPNDAEVDRNTMSLLGMFARLRDRVAVMNILLASLAAPHRVVFGRRHLVPSVITNELEQLAVSPLGVGLGPLAAAVLNLQPANDSQPVGGQRRGERLKLLPPRFSPTGSAAWFQQSCRETQELGLHLTHCVASFVEPVG